MESSLPQDIIKYCPKCGSAEVAFDGLKAFVCSQCKFQFFANSAATVDAIIENDEGEILLCTRAFEPAKGMLDLPGGFVDSDESLEEALIREIKEELDLDIEIIKYVGSFSSRYYFSGITVYTCDAGFYCRVSDFSKLKAMDDVAKVEFYKPADIPWDMLASKSMVGLLKMYLNQ